MSIGLITKEYIENAISKLRIYRPSLGKIYPIEFGKAVEDTIRYVDQSSYEGGKIKGAKIEREVFWQEYQEIGERRNHAYAFAGVGWTDEIYNPLYDLICTNAGSMFANSKITDTKVTIDWTKATTTSYAFSGNTSLVTIRELIVSETTPFVSTTFQNLKSLVNCNVTGKIGKSGIDLRWSDNLSKESITSFANALSETAQSTEPLIIQFSEVAINKAFETSEGANDGAYSAEWNLLVSSKYNWQVQVQSSAN